MLGKKCADGWFELFVLRRAAAAARVWHGFEDVQFDLDSGGQQPALHPDRVRQQQVSGAGLQERWVGTRTDRRIAATGRDR
jgi:hypothetical protein